ncbi:hypothetical protein CRYUN_Cryun11dG0044300 [Craigia yunnanensis]
MEFGWNSESDSIVHLEIGISMAGGSRGHRNTSFGYLQPVPKDYGGKQITSCDCRVRQGEQSSFHQKTSKTSYVDKQTGKYTRTTNKKVVSTGETFKERSTGRVGYKDEYKTTSTYRVGDKCGYTEHQLEEKIRRVNYGGSSGNKKGEKSAGSYKNDGAASIVKRNMKKVMEMKEVKATSNKKRVMETKKVKVTGNKKRVMGRKGEEYSFWGDSDDYGYY